MRLYEYKCTSCNRTFLDPNNSPPLPCPLCGTPANRRFSFFKGPSFGDGYSPTLGRYVSNERDFADGLKRASEIATERNGIPHNYVPVDLRDRDALGVTDEGIS